MTPTHNELAAALVLIGTESCALTHVRALTLKRLTDLCLIHREPNGWVVTDEGAKLVPLLQSGEHVEILD
jgi:hypothetical protein